jgi:hypothetical protein
MGKYCAGQFSILSPGEKCQSKKGQGERRANWQRIGNQIDAAPVFAWAASLHRLVRPVCKIVSGSWHFEMPTFVNVTRMPGSRIVASQLLVAAKAGIFFSRLS